MPTALHKLLLSLTLASTLALGGCFFGDSIDVSRGEENPDQLNLFVNDSRFAGCFPLDDLVDCEFFQGRDSVFGLSGLEFLLFLFLVDPILIQLPDNVSIAGGLFSHPVAGNGNLTVNGPLSSVAIDRNRSLTAETGTSLYVVSFPDDVLADVTTSNGVVLNPISANPVGFNLQLTIPTSLTTSFSAKAIIAAHARTLNGDNYYPPLFPCVTSMAEVTALTVPVPVLGGSGILDLSAAATAPVCTGSEIFDVSGTAVSNAQGIPLFGFWGLASLAAFLSTLAVWRMRRHGR